MGGLPVRYPRLEEANALSLSLHGSSPVRGPLLVAPTPMRGWRFGEGGYPFLSRT